MMNSRVVSDDGLTATSTGFDIDVRLPWYRALPLSTVEIAEVSFDGCPIDLGNVRFEVNGKTLELGQLRQCIDEWWYVLDSALLHVAHAPVEKGSAHDVAVTIALRPPYIKGLVRMTKTRKILTAL